LCKERLYSYWQTRWAPRQKVAWALAGQGRHRLGTQTAPGAAHLALAQGSAPHSEGAPVAQLAVAQLKYLLIANQTPSTNNNKQTNNNNNNNNNKQETTTTN